MKVSLTPELEQFVAAKVDSGRYTSASEAVRETLRLLEDQDLDRRAPSPHSSRNSTPASPPSTAANI